MSFLQALRSLLSAVGKALSMWRDYEAEEDGKNELRAKQRKSQLEAAREAQEIEEAISSASDDELNRRLRRPSERS